MSCGCFNLQQYLHGPFKFSRITCTSLYDVKLLHMYMLDMNDTFTNDICFR